MPSYDFKSPRLYVSGDLAADAAVPLAPEQAHYLSTVLRLKADDEVLVFNGRQGEWRARLAPAGRRSLRLTVLARVRPQTPAGDLHYLFAPLKQARLDYMMQKAVEMGASRLMPVLTQHGQVGRVNLERVRANAIEAAEQCGILSLPEIVEPAPLASVLQRLEPERLLVFCDERAEVQDPLQALAPFRVRAAAPLPLAILVGPEGGFAPAEREAVLARRHVVRIALGPRILRADTAAVAALALVQAALGDWR